MLHKLSQVILMVASLIVLSMVALADPGTEAVSLIANDQNPANVLIYNVYTSNPTNPAAENTSIGITNADDQRAVAVHFFFVDGATCSVADNYICLTKSQTMSFLASDVDPGVTGYIIAFATDSRGLPVKEARLIGDEYVKFASGHAASLAAEGVVGAGVAGPDMTSITLEVGLPRVLAVSRIPSEKDGNNTKLIVNAIGGDLRTSGASMGRLFGLVFDELENGYSFNASGGCQINRSLSDSFPRTAPRLSSVIPAGAIGWMKFWSVDGASLLGAVINFNPNAGNGATAFNGGHNLHKLTYNATTRIILPIFPNMCANDYDRK